MGIALSYLPPALSAFRLTAGVRRHPGNYRSSDNDFDTEACAVWPCRIKIGTGLPRQAAKSG